MSLNVIQTGNTCSNITDAQMLCNGVTTSLNEIRVKNGDTLTTVWKREKYIFNNGATSDYIDGWSVESGADYLNRWESLGLSIGDTISARLQTGYAGDAGAVTAEATVWITSDDIDFSNYNTINITTVNTYKTFYGTAEVAYYIDDTLLKNYYSVNNLINGNPEDSGSTVTFSADISNIKSGKLRIKLYIHDESDYYGCTAHFAIKSIVLNR